VGHNTKAIEITRGMPWPTATAALPGMPDGNSDRAVADLRMPAEIDPTVCE
jgi:hypothetical protein